MKTPHIAVLDLFGFAKIQCVHSDCPSVCYYTEMQPWWPPEMVAQIMETMQATGWDIKGKLCPKHKTQAIDIGDENGQNNKPGESRDWEVIDCESGS